ncbi:MAG TPA: hypothetical protein DEB52_11930 [Hyphomonas sp.]|nr:hypothetical protein [Hyphomonas sp.]HBT36696.1 hypothetical protein [Hyphomonas sp.]
MVATGFTELVKKAETRHWYPSLPIPETATHGQVGQYHSTHSGRLATITRGYAAGRAGNVLTRAAI